MIPTPSSRTVVYGALHQALGWLLAGVSIAYPGFLQAQADRAESYAATSEYQPQDTAMAAQLREWADKYERKTR